MKKENFTKMRMVAMVTVLAAVAIVSLSTTYFPDPNGCQWYYECIGGVPIHKQCPSGLYWNQSLESCGFLPEGDCILDGPGGGGEVPDCSGDGGGNGDNKYDCEKRDCEVQIGIPPLVIVKHGYWYKCILGSTYPTCGSCNVNCDALF